MRRIPFARATAAFAIAMAAVAVSGVLAGEAAPAVAPALAARLRYIGRDSATGMPTLVDDRFIAEVERSYKLYGIEEFKPIPAPPPGAVDIARIAIPALGVDNPVGRYGLDNHGRLDIPQDTRTIGWNPAYNSLPGEGGATFFAAHYTYAGRPGVFNRLSSLAPGDEVAVTLTDGTVHRYRVTSVVDYALESIDMGAILAGREGRESIALMTCSGPVATHGYAERTVVLADRVDERAVRPR